MMKPLNKLQKFLRIDRVLMTREEYEEYLEKKKHLNKWCDKKNKDK